MSTLASWWFNRILGGADNMADNYILFARYMGGITVNDEHIGINRDETLVRLVHNTVFDDTVLKSLHLSDDSTDYQNTSGKTAYAIVTLQARTNSGVRAFKIWSAPTTDSKTAATEVFDSTDKTNPTTAWNAVGELLSSYLVPITDQHYIVIENTSGATSREIRVTNAENDYVAIVIEQAP